MTPKQKRVLDFVTGYVRERGYSPTYREIKSGTGLSIQTVQGAIGRLVDEGKLRRLPRRARSVEPVGDIHERTEAAAA